MKREINSTLLPTVETHLQRLGKHLRLARQSRGWTVADAASRFVTSVATYKRMESGDPAVSLGTWANALSQLKLLESVVAAASPTADALGEALREKNLKIHRVRPRRLKDDPRYDF